MDNNLANQTMNESEMDVSLLAGNDQIKFVADLLQQRPVTPQTSEVVEQKANESVMDVSLADSFIVNRIKFVEPEDEQFSSNHISGDESMFSRGNQSLEVKSVTPDPISETSADIIIPATDQMETSNITESNQGNKQSTNDSLNDSLVLGDLRLIFNTSSTTIDSGDDGQQEPKNDIELVSKSSSDTTSHKEVESREVTKKLIDVVDACNVPVISISNQPKSSSPKKTLSEMSDTSLCDGNDSLILKEVKIEFNPRECLDDSPYLKTLQNPKPQLAQRRKREINDENDTPHKSVCSNLFNARQLSSTPFNANKKWRSASYNPGTSSPKKLEHPLISPLMQIDSNIMKNAAVNKGTASYLEHVDNSNSVMMQAIQKAEQNPGLIGDYSTDHALPLVKGRHSDLRTISPEALAGLMRGEYKHIIDSFTIVDARYPYEYEGGHIDGSKNIYQRDEISNYFFGSTTPAPDATNMENIKSSVVSSCSSFSMTKDYHLQHHRTDTKNLSVIHESMETDVERKENIAANDSIGSNNNNALDIKSSDDCLKNQKKRHAIIFHCEFSSERGPTLYRYLRNKDREMNQNTYPHLHYPEIYLLHGGYKLFFEKYKDLCFPETYLPMHSNDHKQDLKKFRTKSKSWHCERNIQSKNFQRIDFGRNS